MLRQNTTITLIQRKIQSQKKDSIPGIYDESKSMTARVLISIYLIMAYGSTPYAGMTLKKMVATIKSAQMTRSKCLH